MTEAIANKVPLVLDQEELPIIWVTDINQETAQDFIAGLIRLASDPKVENIFVYITSYGGELYPTLGMVDAMLECEKPVHTVCSGMCMSAGAVILSCGTGIRWMGRNSYLHIHHGRKHTEGDILSIEQDTRQGLSLDNKMLKLLTRRSKMTHKELRARLGDEQKEWQLSAYSALKYGFVDRIGLPVFTKQVITTYR